MGLPFPGPDFFEPPAAYQTLSPEHVIFQLSNPFQYSKNWKGLLLLWLVSLGTTVVTRHHCCTPIVLVFQTGADIRIRIRSIVIRIRIRYTAIRVRIVVPAIDHAAYWETPPLQSY